MQPGQPPDMTGWLDEAKKLQDQTMPDLAAALAQMQQVQQQLMEAQEKIANSEVHGQAGGGLVQVTVNGSGKVTAVRIDPKVVDPNDVETLQDLIVGALDDSARQMAIMVQTHLGPLAAGAAPEPGGAHRRPDF